MTFKQGQRVRITKTGELATVRRQDFPGYVKITTDTGRKVEVKVKSVEAI